jgi:hypothetical protein
MVQYSAYTNATAWYRNNTVVGSAKYRSGVSYEDTWMSVTLEQRRVGNKCYIRSSTATGDSTVGH